MHEATEPTSIVTILRTESDHARRALGIGRLERQLQDCGYQVHEAQVPADFSTYRAIDGLKLVVASSPDPFLMWLKDLELFMPFSATTDGEGFAVQRIPGDLIVLEGGSETGELYACLALCDLLREERRLPEEIALEDRPDMTLRGVCLGLQRTTIEPPRLTYEYPVTPERFPWFYDRHAWIELLDRLLDYRANILYLWSGHPFSSFVDLPDWPEALEVTRDEFIRNQDMLSWLSEACEARGIWLVFSFYNIHIPLPFAEKHGLELLQNRIDPLVAAYSYEAIASFIATYPRVGLMVTLGEALRGNPDKTRWFAETILPAVAEGVRRAELEEAPPVILRGHDCDPVSAMAAGREVYSNLYTMWKYNGESLTTWLPRGKWRDLHQALAPLTGQHIMNVHILANLEPFRFMSPIYIQRSILAGRHHLGANGLHLYPLFYWDWPDAPDRSSERIRQLDRDWLWFEAWLRYAWRPERDRDTERLWWCRRLREQYGLDVDESERLLEACELSGSCLPDLLGRIGITEGNRQTFTLGMTMPQLTNAKRFHPNYELARSVARVGESIEDFVKRELKGQSHVGETPLECVARACAMADRAVDIADNISLADDDGELARIRDDIRAIARICHIYRLRIHAAIHVLIYRETMNDKCQGNLDLLRTALTDIEASVNQYRELTALTARRYRYCNSMRTKQRRIPFPDGAQFGHWQDCLPAYEKELEILRSNIEQLQHGHWPGESDAGNDEVISAAEEVAFDLLDEDAACFRLLPSADVFTDREGKIINIAAELTGLRGVRFDMGRAIADGKQLTLHLHRPAKILVAYFNSTGVQYLQKPQLETDTHADMRGGLEPVLRRAIHVRDCPSVDIHALAYDAGTHTLNLGVGAWFVAGVVAADTQFVRNDAAVSSADYQTLDWLFETS